jgi:hypothetical protein
MAMIEINKNPSRKELLWFGTLIPIFFGIVGGLLYWRLEKPDAGRWIWMAAAAVTLLYFVIPPLRRLIYLGWMYAAFPIGFVISYLVMILIFYVVVTPIGLAMRLMGRDSMCRGFEPAADSYWVEREGKSSQERYFRQF